MAIGSCYLTVVDMLRANSGRGDDGYQEINVRGCDKWGIRSRVMRLKRFRGCEISPKTRVWRRYQIEFEQPWPDRSYPILQLRKYMGDLLYRSNRLSVCSMAPYRMSRDVAPSLMPTIHAPLCRTFLIYKIWKFEAFQRTVLSAEV